MSKNKKENTIAQVNKLLEELYNSFDNAEAKKVTQLAYNKINMPTKLSTRYKEIPEAIDFLKKDLSKLSLRKKNLLTRNQEEILYELTKFSRQIFQKGFEGMMFANIWFS